jgi:hypothetical protein
MPSYVLYLATYGWWLYCRLIFDKELFEHSDMLFYLWLVCLVFFHISSTRTIHTRYGYTKTTFTHHNKWLQGMIYASCLPIVFFDWPCARNFALFLTQTWRRFWPVIFLFKAMFVASIWAVIVVYMDYNDHWQYYGWLGLSICASLVVLVQFATLLKLYVWIFYLAPFLLYWVLYLIMWPFFKCCACARWCLGLNKVRKDDAEVGEANEADIDDIENEGGDEEDFNMNSDRDLNVRADKYRIDDEENKYLETDANLNTGGKKKKGKKKKSPAKKNKKAEKKDEGEEKEEKKPNPKKKQKKVYKTPIEDLWYFARVWRALQPKYCHHCHYEIQGHTEEFF